MIVCGIDIHSNEAIVVLLKSQQEGITVVKSDIKKISLNDDRDQENIHSFFQVYDMFVKQHQVNSVFIKRPSTSGKFSASPISIKIEAILQLCSTQVILMHPSSIASKKKKNPIPAELYVEINKYQYDALDSAFCGLTICEKLK